MASMQSRSKSYSKVEGIFEAAITKTGSFLWENVEEKVLLDTLLQNNIELKLLFELMFVMIFKRSFCVEAI